MEKISQIVFIHIHRENSMQCYVVIARKRSLRRLCFDRCLSVQRGGGVLRPWGSLSRGVSVWEEHLSPGEGDLCPGGGFCPGGLCQGDPPGMVVTSR